MEQWRQAFPPAKLHMGLANYGFSYTNLKPGEKNPPQVKKGNWFTFRQLSDLKKQGWSEKWDAVNQLPYYFSPDGRDFATLENKKSLTYKINYARKQQFNVFWWEYHCDLSDSKQSAFNIHPLIDHVSTTLDKKRLSQ